MSFIFTEVKEEEGVYKAVFSSPTEEVRLPFSQMPSQTELDDAIAEYEWAAELLTFSGQDKIYKNGALVRVDVLLSQGIIEGTASTARDPYDENHTSTYYLEAPSSQVLSDWGVNDINNIAHWYGIKTLTSGTSFLKVVRFRADWPNEPSFSNPAWAYASVFSEDGTESSIKDLYISLEPEEMRQWCLDNGVNYPMPLEEIKKPWCFGVYWDSDTGVIQGVKGYVRYT